MTQEILEVLSHQTSAECRYNRSDIVVWDRREKLSTVIEVSCLAVVNVSFKISEKKNIYGLYPDYKFTFILIIIGDMTMFVNV